MIQRHAPGGEAARAAETGTGSAVGEDPVAEGRAPDLKSLQDEIQSLRSALQDSERKRMDAEGRAAVITSAFAKFVGVALTAQKSNTAEWMAGLAEDVNEAACVIGTSDRFIFDRRCGLVRLPKSTPTQETPDVTG